MESVSKPLLEMEPRLAKIAQKGYRQQVKVVVIINSKVPQCVGSHFSGVYFQITWERATQ